MDWFKTMTTNAYIRGVKQSDWPPFPGRLWQRNYYERVTRDEEELAGIREYIQCNPLKWEEDEENPCNPPRWGRPCVAALVLLCGRPADG